MHKLKVIGSRKNITDSEYYQIISDLLEYDEVQNLKNFKHHIMTTRFQHSLNVSYYHYKLCRLFRLDAKAAARAGLLHDLYFYDTKGKPSVRHSRSHPEIALENALKLLDLNDKERDMIRNHMFPMTSAKPKYAETYLITLVDKYCAVMEFVLPQPKRLRNFLKQRTNPVETTLNK